MPRRKESAIPSELLDQLLAGGDASAAFDQGGLLDCHKKALTERALNAEMNHHLVGEDGAGNTRNGYGRKTATTDNGRQFTRMAFTAVLHSEKIAISMDGRGTGRDNDLT